MNFVHRHIVGFIFCGAVSTSAALAQSADKGVDWRDMTLVKQTQPWLHSENAAGLTNIPAERLSFGELYLDKSNGDLKNYYQSANSYNWGLTAESIYSLNKGVMLYGKVSYDNFTGKQMTGSTFINPENTPFDIVEYTEDNAGKKNKETYNLVGAIGANLYKGLNFGVKFDFSAANYAKYKDLRHQNKLMDMNITAGLTYELSPSLQIGANYYYRRSTEGLYFKTYGTTDKVYKSLINYGGFFGKLETFGENGYTKETEEKPLFDQYHGGAFQLDWKINDKLSWYNQLSYKSRSGYYGRKTAYTVVYSNHDGSEFAYNTALTLRDKKNIHSLGIALLDNKLDNRENIYRSENESGGGSDIAYYGDIDVTSKKQYGASVSYTANLGVSNNVPLWTVEADASLTERDLTASVYPYYRKQKLSIFDASMNFGRNFIKSRDMYSVTIGAGYRFGNGDKYVDGTYATPTESQSSPKTTDIYLNEEYEYLTASQVKAAVGLKYTRALNPNVNLYTAANYAVGKAFDTEYLGNGMRHDFKLAIGCTF